MKLFEVQIVNTDSFVMNHLPTTIIKRNFMILRVDSNSRAYLRKRNQFYFMTAGETMAANTKEIYTAENRSGNNNGGESVFSLLAPSFHRTNASENLLNPQEPRTADTGSERTESMSSNIWGDGFSTSTARTAEMIDVFDFFVNMLSSVNNYLSMLTREQLSVLRSIRPSLLHEFLQDVIKVHSDKRLRRALPHECAFCKKNGENEKCYSSHALRDWRGCVMCPVLRAMRCSRCGATGDRAHTIKYCSENADEGLERSGSFAALRRVGSLRMGQQPAAPAPSPFPSPASISHSSFRNTFGMN